MFIGISLKCVYPIMVEEGDLWCSDFCKIYLSVKYLLYPLAKFSPRLSSSVWIEFEHPPLYIQPPIWLILLPPILYLIISFFLFLTMFFSHYWPQWMWNKYKDKLIKTQQTQNPYASLTLLHSISHTLS